MKVLSLFDGCAGAMQALDTLGVDCEYYASELDKYAIQIALKNYPNIVQLGDVTELNENNLPREIDLMIGGSPCTSLSIAKRQKESGLEKGESTLFWEYVRILNIVKPKFFILENVASMKNADRDKISEVLGVEPVMINSDLLTAQSRKRYYWVGKLKEDLTYETIPIRQPSDRGIILQDILEDPNDYSDRLKSYCVTATYQKACPKDYFNHGQRQLIYTKPVRVGHIGKKARKKFKEVNGKDGGSRDSNSREGVVKQDQSKSPCLTSHTDARILQNQECVVRRLTPLECEKLQGMKGNYTEGVSKTQRYRMIGNGFTIPVIEYLLKEGKIIK